MALSRALHAITIVALSVHWHSIATATPVIIVGNHHLAANTPGQEITILVTGGDAVEGLNLNVQVGDGGPPLGGSTVAPFITNLDILSGTIFSTNNTGQVDVASFPLFANSTTTTGKATV